MKMKEVKIEEIRPFEENPRINDQAEQTNQKERNSELA